MKSGSEITSTIPVHYKWELVQRSFQQLSILMEGRGFIHIFEYFAFWLRYC